MKSLPCSLLLLFAFSLDAQAPTAVPIPKEPHHHLVLENDYVRVFRVSVPAHGSTLLHQHDVPYLYVSLGPADVINAVQGRPEAHLVMADGQLGYSPGHFAHIARNESDTAFNNVTIELLEPQGEPHNLCASVVAGPLGACPNAESAPAAWYSNALPGGSALFETDEIVVESGVVGPKSSFEDKRPAVSALLIAMGGSQISVKPSRLAHPAQGGPADNLRGGEVYWLPAGVKRSIRARTLAPARFLLLSFKDSGPASPLTGQPSAQRRLNTSKN
jgi:hypothetical protein